MSADAKSARGLRLTVVRSPGRRSEPSTRFVRLSHLHKLRECEQVAAVCYRMRNGGIEFLLVRTRGSGRWTFPKGSAEPGLTHAQAAALEAFEEAGVHGRIEEASFARYVCRKRGARTSAMRSELAVNAHLCQVLRLGKPKECNRNRTWFAVKDARRRLREGREDDDGAEFARVVDRAVARIRRLRAGTGGVVDRAQDRKKDVLQKVQFEAVADARAGVGQSSFIRYAGGEFGAMRRVSVPGVDAPRRELLQCEVLQFSPTQEVNRNPRWLPAGKKTRALGTGTGTKSS